MSSEAPPSPYVVRRLDWKALLPFAVLPAALAFGVFTGLSTSVWFLVLFGLALAWNVWSGSERLRVDADGVRFNRTGRSQGRTGGVPRTVVPWTSIRALVVFVPRVRGTVEVGETELGVRLEHGAPLPSGVRAVIYDPDGPDEVPEALRLPVRGWSLDHGRLAAAVQAYGRGVPLLEARGESERPLTP